MAEIAALPLSEQNDALRAETVGVLLRPCRNSSEPFQCPITYHYSNWNEGLRAFYCRECGPEDAA